MIDISTTATTQCHASLKHTDEVAHAVVYTEADIEPVVTVIVDAMNEYGFSLEHCLSMQMVISELCINAVRHGNCGDPSKKVIVIYTISSQKLHVVIQDEGTGYNPAAVPDPTLPENIHKSSGRGLSTAVRYSDECNVIKPGNCVEVIKYAAGCYHE
jgi:serine/threonine-protein kinase RsbW